MKETSQEVQAHHHFPISVFHLFLSVYISSLKTIISQGDLSTSTYTQDWSINDLTNGMLIRAQL